MTNKPQEVKFAALNFDTSLTEETVNEIVKNYLAGNASHVYSGQTGTFLVYGDDQSGSFASSTVPLLAILEGTFEDVLKTAAKLTNFTYWSKTHGGTIVKTVAHKV